MSALTTRFLEWACAKLAAAGKTALLLVWDNAGWHISTEVREWVRAHNRRIRGARGTKRGVPGVRIVPCPLPTKSPWLNPIEPKWIHRLRGKRKVVEPDRLLTARELAERVCAAFACPYEAHLTIPERAV